MSAPTTAAAAAAAARGAALPALFLDLDGVLADFDTRVFELLGRRPHELAPGVMWPALSKAAPPFFASLAPMPDAQQLWSFARPHRPTVLTGSPRGNWAEPQKRAWVRAHLGADVPVVVCLARDKGRYVPHAGAVLVDDMLKNRDAWVAAGGTFVLHTSAQATIAELRRLGYS